MRRVFLVFSLLLVLACEPTRPTPSFSIPTPTSAAPCTAEQISLSPMTEGATGSTVAYVEIAHSGVPCRLEGVARLSLLDTGGKELPVRGNPSTIPISMMLPTDTGLTWSWQNWCGDPIEIVYEFVVAGRRAAPLEGRAGPRCDAPSGESILQFVQQ